MKYVLLFIWTGLLALSSHAQLPLIGNKEGNWYIIKGKQSIALPEDYHDVGNFDESGFAAFARHNQYGLIDTDGKVVLKAQFHRLKSLGWGHYVGINDDANLHITVRENVALDTCRRWDQKDDYWCVFYKKAQQEFVNLPSTKSILLDSTNSIGNLSMGYASVNTEEAARVFDPKGEELDLGGGFAIIEHDFVRIKTDTEQKLVLQSGEMSLPFETRRLTYDGNTIQYSTDNRTVRMNAFGVVALDVPYSNLVSAGYNRFEFQDGRFKGIMDNTGNVIIPAKYYTIRTNYEGYEVLTDRGLGLISKSGEEIVPDRYKSIRRQGEFHIVQTSADLFGAYSTKRKALVVPAKFQRVIVANDLIRGWLRESLQLAYYDEEHRITKTITLKNTVSRFNPYKKGNSGGKGGTDGTVRIDERLFTLGWFYEDKPIFDDEGFTIGMKQKWGIRDGADSIIVKPRFNMPKFIPTANFSTIKMGNKNIKSFGRDLGKVPVKNAIDVNTGMMMAPSFFDIDTTDALTREYLRFSSDQGFGYITRDNEIHKVMHFDRENDLNLRFSTSETGGYEIIEVEEREAIRMSSMVLNNTEYPEYQRWRFNGKDYDYMLLPGAKWNFLKPTGTPLFAEDFDYADRYFMHSAIVKREGRWGVVNTDSLIIPLQYTGIERVKEYQDTVFLVRRAQKGKRFLDRRSDVVSIGVNRILKNKENYAIVRVGSEQKVLDNNHEVISEGDKSYRALNDHYYMTRKNRQSYVYDAKGSEFASVDVKVKDVLLNRFLTYKNGGRLGLVDDVGDTLLPGDYKSISVYGDMMLAEGNDTRVLNADGEQVFQLDIGHVLVDSVSGQFAAVEGTKITIYSERGEKMDRVKGVDPDLFINGVLIQLGGAGRALSVDESPLELPTGIRTLTTAGKTGFILETKNGTYLVDPNWDFYDEIGNKPLEKCKYLEEGMVQIKSEEKYVFSQEYGKYTLPGRTVNDYNSGLVLCYLDDRKKYIYLTSEGENPFQQEFRDAVPFKQGYAAVKMRGGWTIIDREGRTKSLDSYQKIEVHGNGLFSTQKADLYGLVDHHGEVILEAEYERLKILENNIIQVVKNGEIFYFKMDGTPIPY